MAEQKYTVIRQHQGAKFFTPGDERVADENEVKHLVGTCLVLTSEYEAAQKAKADADEDFDEVLTPAQKKAARAAAKANAKKD